MCDSKKSKFIKEQGASGLLSSWEIKTPLSKNPLVCPLLVEEYQMSETVHKFLLAGDTFMPEMHLRHPRFTYSASWPFTKTKKRIQKFKEIGDSRNIYQN